MYFDTQIAKNFSVKKPLAFFHVGINIEKIENAKNWPS